MTTEHRALSLTPASQIKTIRQRWLWTDIVPLGTITTLAGKGGEGKSTFALDLAARYTRGELDGDMKGIPGSVLVISHEDDWGAVMRPRFEAAGADLDRVYKLSVQLTVDEYTSEVVPAFPLDTELLRDAVNETGAGLIVIDPLTATLGGDLHKLADVRRGLDPIAAVAQELDVAVLGIQHFAKGAGNLSDKLSGSHAFRDGVRSLLMFATDHDTGNRVATLDKSNYSTAVGTSMAFNIESVNVSTDDGEVTSVGRIQHLGEADVSVAEIINRLPDAGEDREERSAIERHIHEYLLDSGGSADARDIIKSGVAQGFKEGDVKKTRLRMKNPKVVSERQGFGKHGKFVWLIDSTIDSIDSREPNSGTYGTYAEPMVKPLATVTPLETQIGTDFGYHAPPCGLSFTAPNHCPKHGLVQEQNNDLENENQS